MRRACLLAFVAIAACSPVPSSPDAGDGDGGVQLDSGQPGPGNCEDPGFARCAGECVRISSDTRHCGACGNACPTLGVCVDGSCGCLPGQVQCGDVCADLQDDAANCGACGQRCEAGTVCSEGACVVDCPMGTARCGTECVTLESDPQHCGGCGVACAQGTSCVDGSCRCPEGSAICGGACVDLQGDPENCGGCGSQCFDGFFCSEGQCVCPSGTVSCGAVCADVRYDPNNCGACNRYCQFGQACVNGACETPCPAGWLRCGAQCVDPQTEPNHCGTCGNACGGLSCLGGLCTSCDSAVTDCDSDGWKVADGDCCDQPGACGSQPGGVNPGALELSGNGIDDNCNGLVDAADALDTASCDGKLASNASSAFDFAQALGLCRTTSENAALPERTWGLVSARLLRVTGEPLTWPAAASIRPKFGDSLAPREGSQMVVLSSGIAADATQTQPGPNGGPFA
ncbi:MAG: MXAN_6577-like cysteine-rich protein, partial [Myxococcaceae bacterium]